MTVRRPGQRGPLSDEDVRLWEMMKQRLEPLRNAKRRVTNDEPEAKAAAGADRPTTARMPGGRGAGHPPAGKKAGIRVRQQPSSEPISAEAIPSVLTSSDRKSTKAKSSTLLAAAAPPPATIERRKSRKLAKGRQPIEAVLDLHGMRQREAHAALRHFILRSHARGCKFVKVITGKGARPTDEDTRRFHDAPETGERGVLKRLVPQWLRESGIDALVVGVSSAGRGHGGEGALYVELRRERRAAR